MKNKIAKIVHQILSNRNKILNDFTMAYIAETGLKPSEIELCEQPFFENGVYCHKFYFRKKQ